MRADRKLFSAFFHGCLRRGIYLAPSPFETAFLCLAHGEDDIDESVGVMEESLREALSSGG